MPADKANGIDNLKPADVNAFYSLNRNSMKFPAGILRDPFFNPSLPNYMNYGAIGSVIGHEVSHGFSGDGRRFEANGQLENWWQPNTEKEYVKKARCIQEQYGNYTDKQIGLKHLNLLDIEFTSSRPQTTKIMKTALKDLSWWRKRTTLERCLTVISILACTLVIGLVSVWISLLLRNEMSEELKSTMGLINASVVQPSSLPLVIWLIGKQKGSKASDVCSSQECLYTASDVLDKMNPAIEPCDDFYEFACGKFNKKTQLSPDKAAESISLLLSTKIKEQIEKIIMEERPKTDPKYLRYPNDFYKACMNTTLIENLGTQTMRKFSDSLGGWPAVVGNSWDSDNSWTWQNTIKKLKQLGFNRGSLLRIYVDEDLKNDTKNIIEVDQPLLSAEAEYLIKLTNSSVSYLLYDYMLDYMVDVAIMFGADRAEAELELSETLQFQMDLISILEPPSIRQNPKNLHNLRTIKDLQAGYPFIQWLDLINAFLPKGEEVDENEVVNLMAPNFLDDLGTLLGSTNKRTIANYLMWNTYDSSLVFLTKLLRERHFHYKSLLLDKDVAVERWKECVEMVTSNLEISVGSLFVRKHFKEDSTDVALKTVKNIRDALDQRLDQVKWMDDNTKQQAKRKLHDMKSYIGYPDEVLDNNELEKYHRDLELDPEKYFESYLNIQVFKMNKMFEKLRKPADKANSIEHFKPTDVNAFYSLDRNIMQFPAGILQDPFFNPNLPNYMNYGAIGSIIGHEISHGFSGDGRRYDADGQLKNWWKRKAEKKYIKKAGCMQEQYGNYTDKQTGLKVNGYRSLKENIADIGGIRLSYYAYEKWVAQNGEEEKLLGLNYTPRQMFWISFAQMWCAKYKKGTRHQMITDSSHLPSDLRVLGSLRNIKEFSRDFQCPNNTVMNPVKKCVVW